MPFITTISKNNIQNFIDHNKNQKWSTVKKIQYMKENSVQRLIQWFSQNEIKFVDPILVKGIEKDYLNLIHQYDPQINPNFNYDSFRLEIEKMFKKHDFDDKYLKTFDTISHSKLLDTPKSKLIQRQKELSQSTYLWIKEKEELWALRELLALMDNNNIQNTKSRTVLFDPKEMIDTKDVFTVQCFFEQDKQGNKHYFSLYELLNDLETFGLESGYPVIDITNIWAYDKRFHTAQKFIKLALVKNILAKYRDYQEVIMYNFKDYEKYKNSIDHQNKPWLLAEKVVELSFRNFASQEKDLYDIKITKASIGEDQQNKIDLIVEIKDRKSGINIQKELQLTINNNERVLLHKKQQIQRQHEIRNANLDLLKLELHLLDQKVILRKNMDRPIWGINSLLSLEDKEFLRKTYDRIITELNAKSA